MDGCGRSGWVATLETGTRLRFGWLAPGEEVLRSIEIQVDDRRQEQSNDLRHGQPTDYGNTEGCAGLRAGTVTERNR
jgi:hypothetical protein